MKKGHEERSRLPDTPKTAQDIWQQSVIGDYLARFKVGDTTMALDQDCLLKHVNSSFSPCPDYLLHSSCALQNDRPKAQKAMEATWNTMEKKEKIMWIKKAAEDQKRYEVNGIQCV